MSQQYSDPARESDPHALPDVEVFELTAREAAELDDDTVSEYLRTPAFRLATMNGRVRERMFDVMIAEQGITGGWFYWFCFPGCMPEGSPIGPFDSHALAVAAMREDEAGART
jgi:hypothetical protein